MMGELDDDRGTEAASRAAEGPDQEAPADHGGDGPPRVLIVDDEAAVRLLIRRHLERRGHFRVVGEAADGAHAEDLAEQLQPDVALLDLRMPDRDGWQALPRVVCKAPRTMVVVVSVLPAWREEEPAIALGAFAYLEKARIHDDLDECLTDLLGEFRRALDGEDVVAPIYRGDRVLPSR